MKPEIKSQLRQYFQDIREGNKRGISWGYSKLDDSVGRIEPGEITSVAAYSGVGKSYFAGNVVDNIIETQPKVKMCIYSSEMDIFDYLKRHIYMRAGVWSLSHKRAPKQYSAKVETEAVNFISKLEKLNTVDIVAPIFDWELIRKHLEATRPDVFFIDFVQQLYFGKVKKKEDAMPLIAMDLLETVKKLGISAVILSQIKNSSKGEDRAITMHTAMDYGKELYRLSHRAFTLVRSKEEGELSKTLDLYIDKAREGETGIIQYDILDGYRLYERP